MVILQIANPTLMEKRGVDFLYPIWNLIERRTDGIELAPDEVSVFYTTYINDFKRPLQQNERSINEAVKERLTPGVLLLYF